MRVARRWTEQDIQALAQRQYGLTSAPAPPLSPEAAEIRLAKIRATRQKLEAVFEQQLTWTGMRGVFEAQYRFAPPRLWRLDYFATAYSLGIELHGGVFAAGRHTTGTGFTGDRVKINAASELGITVLEFTGAMLSDGTAIAQTERILKARGWIKQSGVTYDQEATQVEGIPPIDQPSDAAETGGVNFRSDGKA